MSDASASKNEKNNASRQKDQPAHLAAYSDLFDRLLNSAILLDCELLSIIDVNPACERLFGHTREELLGKEFIEFVDKDQCDAVKKNMRMAKRRYYPHHFECGWNLGKDKRRLMQVAACPLQLSNETETLQVIAKDITEQRELEEKAASYLKELEALNKKLEELSITDEMTKLSNFRHFKYLLSQEHLRSSRYGTPYSIIFCDVDHFKHYNDRNGHPAGDEVLRGVANLLKQGCRAVDSPARYGGEEFVLLCPQTPLESALTLANRLRELIASYSFSHGSFQPLGKVSISIGVATFPFDGQLPEEILKAADQALYASKKNGRNKVTSFASLSADQKKEAEAAA
jgi:diguanylate cyclase (GGDEF)-like protein/PAS domain S-box-containing protein